MSRDVLHQQVKEIRDRLHPAWHITMEMYQIRERRWAAMGDEHEYIVTIRFENMFGAEFSLTSAEPLIDMERLAVKETA